MHFFARYEFKVHRRLNVYVYIRIVSDSQRCDPCQISRAIHLGGASDSQLHGSSNSAAGSPAGASPLGIARRQRVGGQHERHEAVHLALILTQGDAVTLHHGLFCSPETPVQPGFLTFRA